jgi:dihydroflavonol-4-reductase
MKIFITGATGFIGKALLKRLLGSPHQVTCLVRTAGRAESVLRAGFNVQRGDVFDLPALQAGMLGCDWVIHLANLYSMWIPRRADFQAINVEGTRNVLEAALAAGVKRVVYVSTAAVFGQPAERPFNEQSEPGKRLFSEYARTKALADQLAWQMQRQRGLPLTVLYPGIVLGAGDDKPSGRYIRDILLRRVPSTIFNRSVATYVYVDDVAEAILRSAELPQALGERYLLGKYRLSGTELAHMVSRLSGVHLPWLHVPDAIVLGGSYALTAFANLTGIAPPWGLSSDAAWTMKVGFEYDGSKAERELGITYTLLESALKEAIQSYLR